MSIENVMRCVALAGCVKSDHINQHLRKTVPGHGPIGAALDLKIEKKAAIAAENRNMAYVSVTLETAQGRNLLKTRPILVLEHNAGGIFVDNAADHTGRHYHGKCKRVVLNDKGHVRADGLRSLTVVGHNLVIRPQLNRRCNHYPGGSRIPDRR